MAGLQWSAAAGESQRGPAVLGRNRVPPVHGDGVLAGFAFLLFPLFRSPNTMRANIIKGVVFGLALATISAGWWVPQLFPTIHAGFFSHNLGWKTVFGIYLWHIIYGVNLGALYSPLPSMGA
jgi:hypothetical protein